MEADVVGMGARRNYDDAHLSAAAAEHLAQLLQMARPQFEQNLRDIRRVRELDSKLASVEAANESLRNENAALLKRINDMEAKFNELDERFTNVAGLVSAEKHTGRQKESDNRHHDVSADYEQFVAQDMYPIVQLLPPRWQAVALARMSAALFGGERATPGGLSQALQDMRIDCADAEVQRVADRAQALRAEAESLGRQQRFDFDFEAGRPVNPARQVAVPGSAIGEPDEVVEFVVTPGYVVGDGLVVVHQRVFTVAAPGPR
jgi:hypothetical protein